MISDKTKAMSPEALRHALLEMLTERLIPAISHAEELPFVFMEPVSLSRRGQAKTFYPGEALKYEQEKRSRLFLSKWPEVGLHAVRYPYLAAVVEGEIDWRVGITESALKHKNNGLGGSGYFVVPVPRGNFFLMPPGVAYSDGSGFHWERAEPKEKPAVILSMLILPAGFMCHFCWSTADEHICQRQIFVSCPQLLPLVKMLEEELLLEECNDMIVRGQLQTILGYAQRALKQEVIVQPNRNDSVLYGKNPESQGVAKNALDRAIHHIQMNLKDELNPESIARQAYISSRQLDRYFRRELGLNIMSYVTQCRMETAKGLLLDTDLTVKQIGMLVGYENPSSFVQVFKRRVGVRPGSYREKT